MARNFQPLYSLICFLCLCGCSGNITDNDTGLRRLVILTSSGKAFVYHIELANDKESRRQGLMYRQELPQDRGMLLDYGKPHSISIWMKNTYISLDLLFIDENGVIVKIVEGAAPMRTKPLYRHANARAVLEINANQVSEQGIRVGDQVEFDGFRKIDE